tara:strand:- start:78 stop:278 length:201 start_codon:yes stop_codon:yes gene_type:complete
MRDTEKISPQMAAERLREAFQVYYDSQKKVLERRKLDITALKSRAGIQETTVPATALNIIGSLYNE